MTGDIHDSTAHARAIARSRSARTFAAMFAAVPVTLCLFALADTPRPVEQYPRVHEYRGEPARRAALGQTLVSTSTTSAPPATAPTTTPGRSPQPAPPSTTAPELVVAPAGGSLPPTTAAGPRLAVAQFSVERDRIPPRAYDVRSGSRHAPVLAWSVVGASSVEVSGPGIASTDPTGRVVVCPGPSRRDKCRPDRGTHMYVLTATDATGRVVQSTATLEVEPVRGHERGRRH